MKSGAVFDESRRVIESVTLEDQSIRWTAIPEGTIAERELALVCETTREVKAGLAAVGEA